MSADLDPRDELTERLAALGRRPVDPAVQSEHLTALAGVRSSSAFRTSLAGRLKVAAGVMAGFLIGATGLTTAGVMGPLQPIAADVVERATPLTELPGSASDSASDKAKAKGLAKAAKDKEQGGDEAGETGGEKIWGAAHGCPEETEFKNRGQFLKAAKDKELTGLLQEMTFAEARRSHCGKAVDALAETDDDKAPIEAPPAIEGEAPKDGPQNGAANGRSEGKGNADDAGAPAEPGRPADADERKPSETGAKPASVPAPPAVEKADDAAELPASRPPGAPAEAGDDEAGDVPDPAGSGS